MSTHKQLVFEIGPLRFDSLAHTVADGSSETAIPPKVMAVLAMLAENHGRLVTRRELIDTVWDGNEYVGENALNNAIWRVRQILGEVGENGEDGEAIKTVPKTGYQLLPEPRFLETDVADPAGRRQTPLSGWPWPIAATVVAVAGVAAVLVLGRQPQTGIGMAELVTQLPGRELYAAPSPDGSRFAFMHVSPTNQQHIYMQSLRDDGAQPERLTSGDRSYYSPTWAPDGRHLAYLRLGETDADCEVIVRDTLQGIERIADECVDESHRTLSWSPDGRWLVYRRDDPELGSGLYLTAMSANFLPNEELIGRRISCAECPLNDREVSWSPDGKTLAVTRTKNRMSEDVYLFDIERWQYRRLTDGEPSIEGHTWSRDGSHLLYVSDKHSLDRRIWAVDIATGNKRPLGHEGAGFPVYLPDYDAIMFYRRRANSYVASVPLNNEDSAQSFPSPIIQTSGAERSPQYSAASGRLAYYSNISGHNEIWTADADGGGRRQITQLEASAIDPSWSPDGTRLSFLVSDSDTGAAVIHLYDFGTSEVKALTTGFGDLGFPTWAADGESLIVPIWQGSTVDLWRVAIDGSQLTRVTSTGAKFGRESPDGEHIYFNKADQRGLFRMPVAGGTESLVIDDIVSSGFGNWVFSSPDTILYARRKGGLSEIVRYRLATGEREVMLRHPGRTIHRFGMISYAKQPGLLFFTHMEPQQIDIWMAPDPLMHSVADN